MRLSDECTQSKKGGFEGVNAAAGAIELLELAVRASVVSELQAP